MSTQNKYTIKRLLLNWPDGLVYTQRYLTKLGYYHDLVSRYKKSQWIESVGPGAYKKYGDTVNWQAAVSAIQTQLNLPIHPGGRTALELLGYAHYIRFKDRVFLFGKTGKTLPKWFQNAGSPLTTNLAIRGILSLPSEQNNKSNPYHNPSLIHHHLP